MKKSTILLFCALFFFCFTSTVSAFGIPKFGKKKSSGTSSVSIDDALKSQGDLMKTYRSGVASNTKAQGLFAEALGKKDEASKLSALAKELTSGNCDYDCLEKTTQVTEEAQKANTDQLSSAKKMTAASKAKFGEGLIQLGTAVLFYKKASGKSADCLSSAKSVIENAPMMKKLSFKKKLKPVLDIAPSLPQNLVGIGKSLKSCIDFAKTNKIKIPKKATAALGEL